MNNTINNIAVEINRWRKTDYLIQQIAKSDLSLSETDINSVISETETMRFSDADIEYMRFLLTDERAEEDAKSLDYLYKEMARISDIEERKRFYHRNIKPNQESANSYKAMIARQFPGRVFYKMEG